MRHFFKLALLLIGLAIIIYAFNTSKHFYLSINKKLTSKVIDFDNNILRLEDNKLIQLAGVYIPTVRDINYREELVDNVKLLLNKKEISYKIIEKGRHAFNVYPYYNLAVTYLDNDTQSVNEILLKKGMAFFDHGYYKGKNKYFQLEKEAKANKIGLWKNEPKALYIGSRNWWTFHYPECPEIKKIKEKDKIRYYFLPYHPFFYSTSPDLDCRYCREIEKKFKRPLLFRIDEKGMENKKVGDIVD